MLRYGLYTRKSDEDESVTEKSISEQLSECNVLVERDGLLVLKTWEESKSARIPRVRPKWDELVAMVERGEIDAILCWHINRLVRNMEEGGRLVQLFVEERIREIRTPHALYRTGDNILPLVIEAAAATQFSLDLSHAVKRGLMRNFESGNTNSRAPQGYRNARSSIDLKQGIIEVDPERFHLIRETWELMLSGSYSVAQVLDHLNNARGYKTRITKRGGGTPLARSGLYGLFGNPFYMGRVRYKGRVVPGRHLAMVTPDEFDRVQELMRRSSFTVRNRPEFAFTGLMRCVHCRFQITAETKRLKDGRLWTNYRCSDADLQCTKRGMDTTRVEKRIAGELACVQIAPVLGEIALRDLLRALRSQSAEKSTVLTHIEEMLVESDKRLRNLEEFALVGAIRPDRYRQLEDEEFKKRQELLAERERLRSERERMVANAERAIRFVAFAPSRFSKALPSRKKEIARALALEYQFDGKKKTIAITVLPLLQEVVLFAKKVSRPVEPPNDGSGSGKEAILEAICRFGTSQHHELDLPPTLLKELKGSLFPEFKWLLEDEYDEAA